MAIYSETIVNADRHWIGRSGVMASLDIVCIVLILFVLYGFINLINQ